MSGKLMMMKLIFGLMWLKCGVVCFDGDDVMVFVML